MIVIGTEVVERYFADHAGHKGVRAARSQYEAWLAVVARADWRNPADVKASHPKASILKAGRVVFNIKGNDYRLLACSMVPGSWRSASSAPTPTTTE
jgi:mRNA interferase HigB